MVATSTNNHIDYKATRQ